MIKSALMKLLLTTLAHLKTAFFFKKKQQQQNKTGVSTKISNSHHDLFKEENAVEAFYGLIRRLAPT